MAEPRSPPPIEAASCLPPPAVTEQFTAQWMENVRSRRSLVLMDPPDWPSADSRLAVKSAVLGCRQGRFTCVVLDENREHTQVAVRHASLLDAICTELADRVRTFEEPRAGTRLRESGGMPRPSWVCPTPRGSGDLAMARYSQARLEQRLIPGCTIAHPAGIEANNGWVDRVSVSRDRDVC